MKLTPKDNGLVDLELASRGLVTEKGLTSAIIISLLTDRLANPDDRLPYDEYKNSPVPPDRRGWIGDALAETSDGIIGSRLWLLHREKQTEETRRRAIEYAEEALQWLIADGHVVTVEITAEWVGNGRLEIHVIAALPTGGRFTTSIPFVLGAVYAV